MPDLQQFSRQFATDGTTRTQVAGAIASRLRQEGISGRDVDVTIAGRGDNLSEFTIGANSRDPLIQLQAANAALDVLAQQGVENLGAVTPFDPSIDPLAWNVVYKDGGWVVNG